MERKTFHKKWYFVLLQLMFWILFVFFTSLGFGGIFYEDDIPLAGFFWAGVVAIVYWLVKRIIYRIVFGDSILPLKNRKKYNAS
jgi:hypothetical protein